MSNLTPPSHLWSTVWLSLCLGLVWGLCGCGDKERDEVEALLSHMTAAVERGDRGKFKAGLAADYFDIYEYDRERVTERVFELTDSITDLNAELASLRSEIGGSGRTAVVRFRAHLRGGGAAARWEVAELRDRSFVEVVLRRSQGQWRIRSGRIRRALWGRSEGQGF